MLYLFNLLSSPDVNWWTVDYCDVIIRLSFWRHPFTAEHPLLRHWDTFLQTWWRNKLILDDVRASKFIFIFGWTIPWILIPSRAGQHILLHCLYWINTNYIVNNMYFKVTHLSLLFTVAILHAYADVLLSIKLHLPIAQTSDEVNEAQTWGI